MSNLLQKRMQEAGITVASSGKLGMMDIEDVRQKTKEAVKEIDASILARKHESKAAEYIRNYITNFVRNCRSDLKDQLILAQLDTLADEVINDILGFGPLQTLLNDPDVTEIIVYGPGVKRIQYEKDGRMAWADGFFRTADEIMDLIEKIISPINRRVDEKSPMVDARLPDGSRVNAAIPPVAVNGPYLTIRKFKQNFGIADMIRVGSITEKDAKLFEAFIKAELSILVSGGTGSGKTTVLNALSEFISPDDPIVTIEDSLELQLQQPSVRPLETRPSNIEGEGEITMRQLVKNALRMKLRWLIIGETRDGAAFDMLSAINTGHHGLTTVHANTPRGAIGRLETLSQMAEAKLPVEAIRKYIADGFNIIIQTDQFKDGSRKVVRVTEIVGFEDGEVQLDDILVFNKDKGCLELQNPNPKVFEFMRSREVELSENFWQDISQEISL